MTRAERRYRRMDHINRKERILRNRRLDNPPHFIDDKDFMEPWNLIQDRYFNPWTYGCCVPPVYHNFIGGMNKGKIHCSCLMCSAKTKNKKNSRRGKAPNHYYKISDLKKIESMKEQLIF